MIAFPQPSRRVGRLRLRAASQDHARHAAILFEDALRTASLPDAEPSRLVLIRRLALGRLPARAGATDFARRLEQVARDAALRAVPVPSLAANAAEAVCFRDRTEALTLFARRLARRAPVGEWFWPAALPGWRADLDRPAQWLALLRIAEGLPEFTLAAAALVREALVAGDIVGLMAGLPAGIGAQWLRLAGFQLPACERVEAEQLRRETPAPTTAGLATECLKDGHSFIRDPRLVAPLARFLQSVQPADDRVAWLITFAAVADQPLRAADSHLPTRAALWLRHVIQEREARTTARGADARRSVGSRSRPAEGLANNAETELVSVDENSSSASARTELVATEAASESRASLATAASCEVEFTTHGGLLFLIPVLQRLGLPAFLAGRADWLEAGFGAELLLAFGARAGLRATDPLARALANVEAQQSKPWNDVGDGFDPREPTAPERAGPGRSAAGSPTGVDDTARRCGPNSLRPRRARSAFEPWIIGARRWCRRQARIGLHSLIVRPGRLSASPTHLDVSFTLRQSDLRVRRAGLDLDPGWVAWLGRVVRFHYEDSDGH